MKTKIICLLLSLIFLLSLLPVKAFAEATYTDVPTGNWSEKYVQAAKEYNLMQGLGNGTFGFGRSVTRAEFTTILCKMFNWQLVTPSKASFTDVNKSSWYYSYVETALAHSVMDKTAAFSPGKPILREEMAAMLVRALGYKEIASKAAQYGHPFKDVSTNSGYIAIAYDIGMIKGTSATTFAPKNTARREEAAAMLVQVYEKYTSKTEWLHSFYAFSSYSQRSLTDSMNAVSAGWSRMSFDPAKGAYLNTTNSNNNEWNIPSSYQDITGYLSNNSTPLNLSVYMDTSTVVTMPDGSKTNPVKAILLNPAERTKAVQAILAELDKNYEAIGSNPYTGVTIDFEGLKGTELKTAFNNFLQELSTGLKATDKSLYVTVQPVLWNSSYFDGYDYRTIGRLADKVILMAHDYQPSNLNGFEGTTYYKNAALTPIDQVYYSLKAITDPNKGVEDKNKIALAISFTSVAWKTIDNKLVSGTPIKVTTSTVYSRLTGANTVKGYSNTYRNPYITYTTETGENIFLWYEDSRSVRAKVKLAKLFGIQGISFWRLGLIPNYTDADLYYNVMDAVY